MTVEIKKVITRDITLEFKNATNVNIFYIDINNNLQYAQSPRKVNSILIMSDFLVEVGHISDIKLKHIKNMIKYPDMVNIIKHNCNLSDGIYVGDFLLTGIYLLNINKNYNWVYIVGEKLKKYQEDIDFNVGDYGISSHVAK